jgi:hypothetical protein
MFPLYTTCSIIKTHSNYLLQNLISNYYLANGRNNEFELYERQLTHQQSE